MLEVVVLGVVVVVVVAGLAEKLTVIGMDRVGGEDAIDGVIVDGD